MARRRKPKQRGVSPLLVFVIGIALGWIGFAVLHRPATRHRAHPPVPPVALATVAPTPAAIESALPTPEIGATAAPTELPTPAISAVPIAGTHRLAIIIDDCGQWPAVEHGMIALPIPITLSIMPDARYTHAIERAAADADKGIMLHLPMQPIGPLDPGPGKITTAMSDDAIVAQTEADLARVPLARGVNNHEGSKATADPRVMRAVISVLAKDHRFFIDSKTIGDSVAEQTAKDAGVPTAARDVFLDNRADVAYTQKMLEDAAKVAMANGSAIAIGHPRPTTLAAIRAMIPTLEAEGITFTLAQNLVQ
ncbi:MAG: divergent polysaccharide deacetylase family protein [Vulcanimicrobiaceae bacterium]